MKSWMKRMLSLILELCLILSVLPVSAIATRHTLVTQTISREDPFDEDRRYRVVSTETHYLTHFPQSEEAYLTDIPAAGAVLREGMVNRQEIIYVYFAADSSIPYSEIVDAIEEEALVHTGVPTEGDYLSMQALVTSAVGTYVPGEPVAEYTIKFEVLYFDSAEEEQQVNAAVSQLLDELRLEGLSDYRKIQKVYQWLCEHVVYDNEDLEGENHLHKFSAYGALIKGAASSRGYAVLLYRLLLELGLNARLITGEITSGEHAWNIVQLDGLYYNLDAALDAPIYRQYGECMYFLRADANISDHQRDTQFETLAFRASYPMSAHDYLPSTETCQHVLGPWEYGTVETHRQVCNLCGYEQHANHLFQVQERDLEFHEKYCTICEASFDEPHTWDAGTVTLPPTEDTVGIMLYTCTICGATNCQDIPMLERVPDQTSATSNNWNDYDYINASRWTTPIYSYLKYGNGGYTRVEAIDDILTVERYDAQMQFLSRRDIPLELPIFGGAYLCDDYNFVVVGQTNLEENDEVEVIRVIRYTKDWTRVDSVGLFGANTTVPFDAGCLRFARKDNFLFVRTCHEMYTSDDGLNHQANMTFCVDITAMEMEYATYLVEFNPFGYVSHSFNQFILVDGDHVLTLDHGDAYPRSVVMHRADISNGIPTGWYQPETVDVFPIADSTGHYNDTGVAVGGFEYSATHYLVAGNSTSQDGGIDFHGYQRNIFIAATPKDDFSAEATTVTWITNYDEGAGIKLGTPILTKLDNGRFLLMWAVDDRINFCFIAEDGQLDGEVFEMEGRLSDCMPIQVENNLIWYVTNHSVPEFYAIDLNDPGQNTPHVHSYASEIQEPTCTEAGCITYTCQCGDSYTEQIPALGHNFVDGVCTRCGEVEAGPVLLGDVNGDGHVDTTDAKLIMQFDLALIGENTLILEAADVNGDGHVDTTDAKLIMQLNLGLITEFPK